MEKREFFTRSFTGILIVAITLAAIVFSPLGFLAFLALIALLASFEFFRLDLPSPLPFIISIVPLLYFLLILIAGFFVMVQQDPGVLIIILPVMLSIIMLLQLLSVSSPEVLVKRGKSIFATAAYIVVPLLCGTLFLLNEYSYRYVLVFVILIWINDVGAYLTGSFWGTKKIAPQISPGKSLQGTIGGGVLCLLGAFIMLRIWEDISFEYYLILALTTPLFALAGDLWKSSIKRHAGVKDSGNILPGHGGVLDRYDSFLFLLPVASMAYYSTAI